MLVINTHTNAVSTQNRVLLNQNNTATFDAGSDAPTFVPIDKEYREDDKAETNEQESPDNAVKSDHQRKIISAESSLCDDENRENETNSDTKSDTSELQVPLQLKFREYTAECSKMEQATEPLAKRIRREQTHETEVCAALSRVV